MAHQDTPGTAEPDDGGGLIDRSSSATPAEQVSAIVRARITSGEYPRGSRVPSTTTLSQEFGVAPRTIRKALAPIVADGLIETRPGWGTFVTP